MKGMNIFHGIKAAEPSQFEQLDPRHSWSFPEDSPDGRATWTKNGGVFWMVAEPDYEQFYFRVDCDGPVPPWYEWVSEELVDYLFDGNLRMGEELAHELLERGIAPGQPFKVDMDFKVWGPDYGGEYDSEVDWEVIEIEPWPPEKVLRAWETWLLTQAGFLIG